MDGTGAVQKVVAVTEDGPCVAHATESGTMSGTDELQAAALVESTLQNGAGKLRQRAKVTQNPIRQLECKHARVERKRVHGPARHGAAALRE
ncbi:hypothetical protein ON010_g17278 [Phytophthora cinnamomi]|nr:hypothetical protein ON010_g17278 [Phytophthora cinnamomi]